MRLLFVKLKHIGDSLLLTPTVTAARAGYPEAEIWVVARKGCEGILAGCTAIDKVLTAAAPERKNRSWHNWWTDGRLIAELRRERFDYAFELSDGDRGRWLCSLSGARNCGTTVFPRPLPWWWRARFKKRSRFNWLAAHRVEKDFFTVNDCLPIGSEAPRLQFERSRTQSWSVAENLSEFAVLHAGTRWHLKRWALDKWIEVGRNLLAELPHLIISSGPDPADIREADQMQAVLGDRAISTLGLLNWPQLAGLLYRSRLFVGVDTAVMHLAAACQCPSVAIFGPSFETAWRPWRVTHQVVTPRNFPTPITDPAFEWKVEQRKTEDVIVSDVIEACRRLLTLAPAARPV